MIADGIEHVRIGAWGLCYTRGGTDALPMQNSFLTAISLANNPIRTEGFKVRSEFQQRYSRRRVNSPCRVAHRAQALLQSIGNAFCSVSQLNVGNCQILRSCAPPLVPQAPFSPTTLGVAKLRFLQ
jgi:hypothetical protein